MRQRYAYDTHLGFYFYPGHMVCTLPCSAPAARAPASARPGVAALLERLHVPATLFCTQVHEPYGLTIAKLEWEKEEREEVEENDESSEKTWC